MIKINLLPHKRVKALDKTTIKLRIAAISITCMVILVMVAVFYQLGSKSRAVDKRMQFVAVQIDSIKKKVNEVEGYEKSRKDLQQKLKTIQALQKRRVPLTILLSELNSQYPKEVWFTTLHTNGPLFNLSGMARDTKSNVDGFVGKLGSSHVLTDINLEDVKDSSTPGSRVYVFKVSGRLAGYDITAAPNKSAPDKSKDKKDKKA